MRPFAFPLEVGTNPFSIVAAPSAGGDGVIYRVDVIREPAAGVVLTDLVILDDQDPPNPVNLTPSFSSSTLDYSAGVSSGIQGLRITATAASSDLAIYVNGAERTSGEEFVHLLTDGLNDLLIKVYETDDDPAVTPYAINVNKLVVDPPQPVPSAFFVDANLRVEEESQKVPVRVSLTNLVGNPIDLPFTVTGGTGPGEATPGEDFNVLTSSPLHFEVCEAYREIEIEILHDMRIEGDESLDITLSDPGSDADLGLTHEHTLTIIDNDFPAVTFRDRSSSADEDAGSAGIEMLLNEPSVQEIVVSFAVTGGDADQPGDFDIAGEHESDAHTMIFPAGVQSRTIGVYLVDNVDPDGDKHFMIELLNVEGGQFGRFVEHRFRILDDEMEPRFISFDSPSSSGSESQTTPGIEVTITPEPVTHVTVDYAVTGGSATPGEDYTLNSGTLTFPAGETGSQWINFEVVDDNVPNEDDETIEVTLSNPTGGAEIGEPSVHVYTIEDDDCSILYVRANIDIPGGGCSWGTAYKYLQDALEDASTAGGSVTEIRVAAGTYYPDETASNPNGSDDRNSAFQLISGVTMLGGYPADGGATRNSNPETNGVDLNGNVDHEDDNSDLDGNSYTVVLGATCTIDGFAITGGNANDYPHGVSSGGGMRTVSCSPIINNCWFHANCAHSGGGAMWSSASNTITSCKFSDNVAMHVGGLAISFFGGTQQLSNCVLTDNSNTAGLVGTSGGGILAEGANLTITNTHFVSNELMDEVVSGSWKPTKGGAIYATGGNLSISGCTFTGNTCNAEGGALCIEGTSSFSVNTSVLLANRNRHLHGGAAYISASQSTISKCTFDGNRGVNGGAVAYSGCTGTHDAINTVFFNNEVDENGGAVYSRNSSLITLTNCSYSKNNATTCGGALFSQNSSITIHNSIFWFDFATVFGRDIDYFTGAQPTVRYCDIQQSGYAGSNNNIGQDPMFASDPAEPSVPIHLRLKATSPCRDIAGPGAPSDDRDGITRNDPDLGAYEYVP